MCSPAEKSSLALIVSRPRHDVSIPAGFQEATAKCRRGQGQERSTDKNQWPTPLIYRAPRRAAIGQHWASSALTTHVARREGSENKQRQRCRRGFPASTDIPSLRILPAQLSLKKKKKALIAVQMVVLPSPDMRQKVKVSYIFCLYDVNFCTRGIIPLKKSFSYPVLQRGLVHNPS